MPLNDTATETSAVFSFFSFFANNGVLIRVIFVLLYCAFFIATSKERGLSVSLLHKRPTARGKKPWRIQSSYNPKRINRSYEEIEISFRLTITKF
jgi:type IV secretory pathway VirB3-like protein